MKYKKANEILPDELLREVQKYISGETLYIPKTDERQKWGRGSGAREYYRVRNEEIRQKKLAGQSAQLLAEEYNLSVESIRKIIYDGRQ